MNEMLGGVKENGKLKKGRRERDRNGGEKANMKEKGSRMDGRKQKRSEGWTKEGRERKKRKNKRKRRIWVLWWKERECVCERGKIDRGEERGKREG